MVAPEKALDSPREPTTAATAPHNNKIAANTEPTTQHHVGKKPVIQKGLDNQSSRNDTFQFGHSVFFLLLQICVHAYGVLV